MITVPIPKLHSFIESLWLAWGGRAEDARLMADIYTENTERGMGHHDIHNLPSRIEGIRSGMIDPRAEITLLSSFGAMESWDGHHGAGEVLSSHIMKRACDLASVHGLGFAAVRNSNHYLSSAPYVRFAAENGYVGFIMAKAAPAMGMPGQKKNLIGQAPVGYAFPTGGDPVMLDMCLAYIAHEPLKLLADAGGTVPSHFGVDAEGKPAEKAEDLLAGIKYPVGEHKGFGLALLEELLTGVFSSGAILDEGEDEKPYKGMTHTALAIKTDALMDRETYEKRADELVSRLRARGENVHVPGDGSREKMREAAEKGSLDLEETLLRKLNGLAESAPAGFRGTLL